MNEASTQPAFGAYAPGWLDRAVIALTSRLPRNWLGRRLAILFRRAVTMRLEKDGALDVEQWGLRLRLHPRDNSCEKGVLFTPQMFDRVERADRPRPCANDCYNPGRRERRKNRGGGYQSYSGKAGSVKIS